MPSYIHLQQALLLSFCNLHTVSYFSGNIIWQHNRTIVYLSGKKKYRSLTNSSDNHSLTVFGSVKDILVVQGDWNAKIGKDA